MKQKSNKGVGGSISGEVRFKGIPASPGIALGTALLLRGDVIQVQERSLEASEVEREIEKFYRAIDVTKSEVRQLREQVIQRLGADSAKIFDAHQLLLEDAVLLEETVKRISEEKKNADFIFLEVMRKFQDSLHAVNNDYFKERVADLQDIQRRVLRNIQGRRRTYLSNLTGPVIVVAHDLTPSDTVLVDRRKVLGFATDLGGRTSHAAIMARAMEVPAVMGLRNVTERVKSGDRLIVDGTKGVAIINPEPETLTFYQNLRNQFYDLERRLHLIRTLPSRTLDGKDIELSANIEFPDEVEAVISHGARGIGLYRTEYLYLARETLPTEDEQFEEYRRVTERVYPDPVIIRTMDIGGDKNPPCLPIPEEENPFLGWRAIRICLAHPEIFEAQLRAILRASFHGNVRIMFPMISGLEELRQAKKHLEKVKADLRREGVPFDEKIEMGVMIEVPSAAMVADLIAEEVDFLSIGTNDLIQYTLAVDRGNERISSLYTALHPAVLRLIRNIVDAGHSKGVWVGMCGEMAGDPLATMILVGLGLDELSVSPIVLPEIKQIIRCIEYVDAERVAKKALEMPTSYAVERFMRRIMRRRFKEIPL